jgi:hypothetical protein
MPAVAFRGLRADPFLRLLTTPGLGRLVARAPAPKTTVATRKALAAVLGEGALDRTPDAFFDVVRWGCTSPAGASRCARTWRSRCAPAAAAPATRSATTNCAHSACRCS